MDIQLQFSSEFLRTLLDERLKAILVRCRAPTTVPPDRELAVAHIRPGNSTFETDTGPHKVRLAGSGGEFSEIEGRRLIYRVPLTLPLL